MKASIKKKWVAALRSGEYKKTEGRLRDSKGFCCLGVLCNLHAQAHPEIAAKETNPRSYLGQGAVLPFEVRAWAGIDGATGPSLHLNGREVHLPSLNDYGIPGIHNEPLNFAQIADIIEAQL